MALLFLDADSLKMVPRSISGGGKLVIVIILQISIRIASIIRPFFPVRELTLCSVTGMVALVLRRIIGT